MRRCNQTKGPSDRGPVSYTHLRAHETKAKLVCRRPPRSPPLYSSAASDVYKRQIPTEQLRSDFDAVVLCGGATKPRDLPIEGLSLIHISEPTRLRRNSYAGALRDLHLSIRRQRQMCIRDRYPQSSCAVILMQ